MSQRKGMNAFFSSYVLKSVVLRCYIITEKEITEPQDEKLQCKLVFLCETTKHLTALNL